MTNITNILTSIIIAIWIAFIAIFSIQNIQPVTLNFFWFQSIQLTTGIVLSFSLGIGLILGTITFNFNKKRKKVKSSKNNKSKFSRPRREDFTQKNNNKDPREDWGTKSSEEW